MININPFAYHDFDPNGYIRHLLIGLIIGAFGLITKQVRNSLIAVTVLAFGKELYDWAVKDFWEVLDIVFTFLGWLTIYRK